MTRKHFIALANAIRAHNRYCVFNGEPVFLHEHLVTLADFCQSQNPMFNRQRWLDFIGDSKGEKFE